MIIRELAALACERYENSNTPATFAQPSASWCSSNSNNFFRESKATVSFSGLRSLALASPLFRSHVQPRAAHARAGVRLLLLLVAFVSLLALSITYKNIEFKRVTINLATSRAALAELQKEQAQLSGEIQSLAAYPRIAAWAESEFGWKIAPEPPRGIVLPRQELSASAQKRWDILSVRDE